MSGQLPVMEDDDGPLGLYQRVMKPKIENGVNVTLLNELFADEPGSNSEQEDSYNSIQAIRTRCFVRENTKKNPPTDIDSDSFLLDNPVGALRNICMARKWGLPEYRIEKRRDNNALTYHVTSTILNFSMNGTGDKQEIAKNDAAYKLYQRVVNLSRVEPHTLPIALIDGHLNFKNAKLMLSKTKHVFKKFFDMLYFTDDQANDKIKNLSKLHEMKLSTLIVLDMIGKLEEFDVNYYIVGKNLTETNDHIEMMIQLSTNPIMYLSVVEASVEIAQESAAYDMLLNFGSMI